MNQPIPYVPARAQDDDCEEGVLTIDTFSQILGAEAPAETFVHKGVKSPEEIAQKKRQEQQRLEAHQNLLRNLMYEGPTDQPKAPRPVIVSKMRDRYAAKAQARIAIGA